VDYPVTNPRSVLITGAAGGIGSAVARAYAGSDVHLFLGDRRAEKLELVGRSCEELGATTCCRSIDVTDSAAMKEWIDECESVRELDLVISNAGISHGNLPKEETEDETRAVFAVNLDGMLNTIFPALPLMRARRRGQIALMSSLAGFRGFPHSPSYCATKAAIRVFGQGLRARVRRDGVSVCVIIPAFVKTSMTEGNLYGMPWIVETDRAAQVIKRNLARDKGEFVFPLMYSVVAWGLSVVPGAVMAHFTELK